MYCSKCGKEISDDSKFCFSCGSIINVIQNNNLPIQQTSINKEENYISKDIVSENEKENRDEIKKTFQYYFKRFQIMVISFYSLLILSIIINVVFEGDIRSVLGMIFSVCLVGVGWIMLYYTWICSKLVGKRPLVYSFSLLILSIIGPIVIYEILRRSIPSEYNIKIS